MDPLSSELICYFVHEDGGGWTVAFDHQTALLIHVDRQRALSAAREAAEARWLITGQASCVRIGSANGESDLDQTFGPQQV